MNNLLTKALFISLLLSTTILPTLLSTTEKEKKINHWKEIGRGAGVVGIGVLVGAYAGYKMGAYEGYKIALVSGKKIGKATIPAMDKMGIDIAALVGAKAGGNAAKLVGKRTIDGVKIGVVKGIKIGSALIEGESGKNFLEKLAIGIQEGCIEGESKGAKIGTGIGGLIGALVGILVAMP